MDDIVSLAKRRGFIFPASEIYGGINGFWDYGPLGTQLKKNLRDAWWQDVVMNPCCGINGPNGQPVDIVPLESRIIQNPKVWEASGHIGGFNDPMQTCKQCKKLFRADHVWDMLDQTEWFQSLKRHYALSLTEPGGFTPDHLQAWVKSVGKKQAPGLAVVRSFAKTTAWFGQALKGTGGGPAVIAWDDFARFMATEDLPNTGLVTPCPNCGGDLTAPRAFNLMFKTYVGATATDDDVAYLRPETAQGIFINFKNVVDTSRVRVPFGIAQTGTAFRNEVTPRNFTFRSREFEQMEIEFFCHPDDARDWYTFWRDWRMNWWKGLGLAGENLILREHDRDELAHYAKDGAGTSDVEYRFPFTAPGFGELEGIAHRSDFDLRQHEQHSGAKLHYFDTTRGPLAPNGQPKGEHYLPHVIEPSAGLDRGVLAILCEAYTFDDSRPSKEFMRFHPRLAPIKAAVFPLVNKDGMPEVADKLTRDLRARFGHLGFIETDAKQSIGKRYARMDEAGCPFCFTIDSDTLTNQTVTIRDRDTGLQDRIALEQVQPWLAAKLGM
jgi:glycyl-tRNA synthetase